MGVDVLKSYVVSHPLPARLYLASKPLSARFPVLRVLQGHRPYLNAGNAHLLATEGAKPAYLPPPGGSVGRDVLRSRVESLGIGR